jgi:hypothetical protein
MSRALPQEVTEARALPWISARAGGRLSPPQSNRQQEPPAETMPLIYDHDGLRLRGVANGQCAEPSSLSSGMAQSAADADDGGASFPHSGLQRLPDRAPHADAGAASRKNEWSGFDVSEIVTPERR